MDILNNTVHQGKEHPLQALNILEFVLKTINKYEMFFMNNF